MIHSEIISHQCSKPVFHGWLKTNIYSDLQPDPYGTTWSSLTSSPRCQAQLSSLWCCWLAHRGIPCCSFPPWSVELSPPQAFLRRICWWHPWSFEKGWWRLKLKGLVGYIVHVFNYTFMYICMCIYILYIYIQYTYIHIYTLCIYTYYISYLVYILYSIVYYAILYHILTTAAFFPPTCCLRWKLGRSSKNSQQFHHWKTKGENLPWFIPTPRLVHSTILLLDFDIISSCCWTWFSLFPSITPIEA